MKQYLNSDQTAKLIELGFEKPRNTQYIQRAKARNLHSPFIEFGEPEFEGSYSIGELLELLPESASLRVRYIATKRAWIVDVDVLGKQGRCHRGVYYKELIDALYDMIVRLKEEGVI